MVFWVMALIWRDLRIFLRSWAHHIQWIQNQEKRTSLVKEKWIRYQFWQRDNFHIGHHWTISTWPISWSFWSFEVKGSPLEEPEHALWDTAVGESHSQIFPQQNSLKLSELTKNHLVVCLCLRLPYLPSDRTYPLTILATQWHACIICSATQLRCNSVVFLGLNTNGNSGNSVNGQVQRLFEAQRRFIQLPLEVESSSWLEPLESTELGGIFQAQNFWSWKIFRGWKGFRYSTKSWRMRTYL